MCPDVCLEKCDLPALALPWSGDEMEIVLCQWEMLWMEQEVSLLEEQSQRKALLAHPDTATLSLRVFFYADHDVCVLCCLGN